ncbi:hypothetical protein [Flavobacterium branchiicola]|uniref:Uncharacterized protein n=1 Tax=Flavobacterium branchiicola TaxID=1114875 RepID=A0ABV9PCG2_9FLAO|nr:hypothetical protein [Flavobacterium branchiicola]MBS7253506.1 hypothetical protein [Flavobacterium branchiicola]
MSVNHNRIKVSDLEKNEPGKILKTNEKGELEFTDTSDLKTENYNALDCTVEGKALDARQGKVLKDMIDLKPVDIASDAETQITAAVPEDNKAISRSKLFNWWKWIKSQNQTISGPWNFGNKVTLASGTTSTPPLIIPSGTLTSATVDGAIETNANGIYYTINGLRKNLITEYVVDTQTMNDAYMYLWGNGTIGTREDIVTLFSNKKVFNDFTSNQYAKYKIDVSGILSRMNTMVTDVKFELQMLISNSSTPTTWYTISKFEDTRVNLTSTTSLPQQINLSSDLLIAILYNKTIYISGKSSTATTESFFKTKTQNLATSQTDPKKEDMLISLRIKATTNWSTAITTQEFLTDFGLVKMIKL